ncbi:MAG: 1-acyl-sn-glycerol-3-phosphate acyltransferase [Oscillospiraceae bacterium]|nr:1-acyl-sn-glycerol-3-phosphate acyltransferase [Oscillospiraceae bacterium]
MNKFLLITAKLLPEPILIKAVRYYVNMQIKKHAKLNIQGIENLNCDLKRPYLFVCNHLSNSDGLIINKVLEKENITFVAGKKLSANAMTNLGFTIIKSITISPNSADKDAISKIIHTVKSGTSVLVFPEGTRSRTAQMIAGKKGILLFAKLTKAPIVPIGIWGTEKFMPINENMGKESFHDANISINIGKAFVITERRSDETKVEWETNTLNFIMKKIAELIPEEYRGVYK